MLERKTFKTDFQGKPVQLEISELAGQANGSVLGKWGETVVLCTAVMAGKDKVVDYFPLTVDYEERFYAAGKIIGSRFVRREGRPSDEAILSGRLIDRTIRPLFDERLRRETQVVITVVAYDGENDPDFIGLLSASLALGVSDIPWAGPVAGVPVKQDSPKISAFFAGTKNKINMIEFEGEEIKEGEAKKLFTESHEEIKRLIGFQEDIIKKVGREKREIPMSPPDPFFTKTISDFLGRRLEETLYQSGKNKRQTELDELKNELMEHLKALGENKPDLAEQIFEKEVGRVVSREILEKERRPDSRKLDEIRPLYAEVGLFKRTHGSALFIRGETQALALTTLAPPGAEQLVETMEVSGKRRFMLHYNFPPYSTGETGSFRGPGRREIGHGALAEKALRNIIPTQEEFPYTIRVVSEVLSSNGSTSMASVSAGCLSLMDAGVPIKKPVAGIAMGLVLSETGEYKILTDIQGPEDHHGDMDLKAAGTADGLTAIQMDVKVEGINEKIFEEVLHQARSARIRILEAMAKALSHPRKELSPYTPRVLTLNIPPDKIGEVIGPGGKTINGIIKSTGGQATIDIEEDGKVFVSAPSIGEAENALQQIKNIIREYEVGEIVEGKVVRILEFGAIVDLGNGKDGMIHVSELKDGFVRRVEDVVKKGDAVRAMVIRAEPDGKIALSLKQLGK